MVALLAAMGDAVVGCDRGATSTSAGSDALAATNALASSAASGDPAGASGATIRGPAGTRRDGGTAADTGDAAARSEETGAARADRFADARPLKGKPIGHTSVVFKVGLEGNLDAAYKPRSRRGNDRYKGEIAAYRLARALGLSNVPEAIPRSFDRAVLRQAFATSPAALDLLDKETVADPDGLLPGALIPWLAKLELLPLESAEWRARWQAWLGTGALADADRPLAAQISTMIVFDWLTANWDRWSGGNVGIDRASGTLLFIDNDGAFFDAPPTESLQKSKKLLERIDRFSRSFVTRMRELNDASLTLAIGEEAPGVPLLSPRSLAGVLNRRKQLLQIIDAKLTDAGESDGLSFP